MAEKTQRNPIDFPYAIRSFVGYLEGTNKSVLTIKSYRLDIQAFQDFLNQEYSHSSFKLNEVNRDDVARYREFLKEKGFKINTRRRKILTVTKFLNYLAGRKKVSLEMAKKIPAPHKMERVPFTVSSEDLLAKILKLPEITLIDLRNKVLLWTLAETGCLVSELTQLRYDQWVLSSSESCSVQLGAQSSRTVPVSIELYASLQNLKKKFIKQSHWIFSGFNRFGPLGGPMTSRGVELLVKHHRKVLQYPDITPRTFRHSIILKWFQDGLLQGEIQARLGLKTTYAFRSYEPILNAFRSIKSKSKTTSNLETN